VQTQAANRRLPRFACQRKRLKKEKRAPYPALTRYDTIFARGASGRAERINIRVRGGRKNDWTILGTTRDIKSGEIQTSARQKRLLDSFMGGGSPITRKSKGSRKGPHRNTRKWNEKKDLSPPVRTIHRNSIRRDSFRRTT